MADWRDSIDYNWGLAKKPAPYVVGKPVAPLAANPIDVRQYDMTLPGNVGIAPTAVDAAINQPPRTQQEPWGLGDISMQNAVDGMGFLSTSLGIYDKFFGQGKEYTDAQIKNANTQAAYNKAALNRKNEFYSGVKASGLGA